MSSDTSVPRADGDSRAAAGPLAVPRGPGLFEVTGAAGRAVTNVRRLAGREREPGSGFVTAATAALGLEAVGLLYVSFAAQYAYILGEKPGERIPSGIEALMLDAGMIIFSFLGLGLARKGKSSRAERVLIMACSGLSAAMNYAAAAASSWRSVLVYVLAPVFLAVVTDRVIAGVRRHVLGDEEASAWAPLGRALRTAGKAAGVVLLYLLRFVLAPPSTATGLRRRVLLAAPVPGPARPAQPREREDQGGGEPVLAGASKKARLTWWYERDPAYGDRSAAAAAARRIAGRVDLSEGTARAYIGAILDGLGRSGRSS